MCSGLAGESWGHLLPQRRRETGEAEGVGLCGHSKGPGSSFNSRAAEPHSSMPACPSAGGGLANRRGRMQERKRPSSLCLHQDSPPGGQKSAIGAGAGGKVTNTGLTRELPPLRNKG